MWRIGRYTRPRGETGYTFLQRVPLSPPPPPPNPCAGATTGPTPVTQAGTGEGHTTMTAYRAMTLEDGSVSLHIEGYSDSATGWVGSFSFNSSWTPNTIYYTQVNASKFYSFDYIVPDNPPYFETWSSTPAGPGGAYDDRDSDQFVEWDDLPIPSGGYCYPNT